MINLDKFENMINKWPIVKFYNKYLKKTGDFIGKVLSCTFFTLLILVSIVLAYYFVAVKVYQQKGPGYEPLVSIYTIISGSMSPAIDVYDVIVVKSLDGPEELKDGDVISYMSEDLKPGQKISVTHKIVETFTDEEGEVFYYTKGDANGAKDPKAVPYEDVTGKVVFVIPQLGRLQIFLINRMGWIILLLIPATFIIVKKMIMSLNLPALGANLKPGDPFYELFNKQVYIRKDNSDTINEIKRKEKERKTLDKANSNFNKASKKSKKKNNKKKNNKSNDVPSKHILEDMELEEIYDDLKNISK